MTTLQDVHPDHDVVWPIALLGQFIVAVVGGMALGFLPEAAASSLYYNTTFEPYSPMMAISAFALGYFASPLILKGRAARFTWVLGFVWLLFGMWDQTRYWSAGWSQQNTRFGYALAHLFGRSDKCSDSECIAELLFTTPFAASVMYSVAASLKERKVAQANESHSILKC
jgi:hypothetical protein